MVCRIKGCGRKVYVKSAQLCSRHYNRLRTTGTTDDGPKARGSIEERFWRHVDKRGDDECWPWTSVHGKFGHGMIDTGGRNGYRTTAHRVAYEIAHGEIPEGLQINHKCRTKDCVNPNHLYAGTQRENMLDRSRDGNAFHWERPKGENHGNAKLTNDQVLYIKQSDKSNAELGREFGMTRQAISWIRKFGWKHLNADEETHG